VHDEGRVTQPRRREDGGWVDIQWSRLPGELDAKLRGAGRLAAVISPHLTVEEAFLLAMYIRGIDPQATLALGHVPRVGEDETFPNGFTIRAEKCPNRRGVESVISRLGGEIITFPRLLSSLADDPPGAIWLSGGYKTDWNDQTTVQALSGVPLIIVQDLFPSPLWEAATYQLPGAAFAERDGSFVNHAHRLQSFRWAIRPPAGAVLEGQLYWRLLNRPGLYDARQVRHEIAQVIAQLSVAGEEYSEYGVDLRVNQLV
jgi:NADH-quinone oxidoreductase subunit G